MTCLCLHFFFYLHCSARILQARFYQDFIWPFLHNVRYSERAEMLCFHLYHPELPKGVLWDYNNIRQLLALRLSGKFLITWPRKDLLTGKHLKNLNKWTMLSFFMSRQASSMRLFHVSFSAFYSTFITYSSLHTIDPTAALSFTTYQVITLCSQQWQIFSMNARFW